MQLKKIDIDFDIHKLIEAERRSFEEPPYIALRRLLGLPELDKEELSEPVAAVEGRPFIEDGVVIPSGSLARMKYQRGSQVYEGRFVDGMLEVDGKRYSALSSAASDLAVTKKGGKTSLNGWLYWEAKFPNECSWRSLNEMREALGRG